QSLKRVSPRSNAEIVAGSLSPAGAVLNLIARPSSRLNTYSNGPFSFSHCFAVQMTSLDLHSSAVEIRSRNVREERSSGLLQFVPHVPGNSTGADVRWSVFWSGNDAGRKPRRE